MTSLNEDFKKLSCIVRLFLNKTNIITRVINTPSLYLEITNLYNMQNMHKEIVQLNTSHDWEYIDERTIKFKTYAGIDIFIICKQDNIAPVYSNDILGIQ